VDDYQKEIADLETQVDQLVEEEGDAKTIAELSMQLESSRRSMPARPTCTREA